MRNYVGKKTSVFLAILWAIPRRYPKMEKGNPSPPIPLIISTQPHLQISKGENPTQSDSQLK
jgi:hypothetical protein